MLDKERDCMKALLIPEARMIFVSFGTGGAPTYRIETLESGTAMSGEFRRRQKLCANIWPRTGRSSRSSSCRRRIRPITFRASGKLLPAQVAKTLTLRVGEDAIIVVTCGDSRLDNRKVKEEPGGKGHMMPGSEASEITGHPVGAITPLCLASVLPVFFDIRLKRFEEVGTGARPTQLSESRSRDFAPAHRRHVGRCLQRDVSHW